jgi:hypothetical protein
VLWDSSHVDYKSHNKKQDANQELTEKFNCDTREVLRKLKIILAQYRWVKQKKNGIIQNFGRWALLMYTGQNVSDLNACNFYEKEMSSMKILIHFSKSFNVEIEELHTSGTSRSISYLDTLNKYIKPAWESPIARYLCVIGSLTSRETHFL